ncbi:hypothetical protein RHMOL_Rhmol13G0147700 [Rhododendron molle]|uniref:Uncharacterized protein n=1 Tax=Rhododendron molle TaxID=49168 RepID=A0ACC0L844_RHOML|nr:hypothetical protein RHMOL_Rhmol13G0147700 [Rhododendron molle]
MDWRMKIPDEENPQCTSTVSFFTFFVAPGFPPEVLLLPWHKLRTGKMDQITNVMEYQPIAKEKLPKMVYDYYASGAEDQWTLQENRNAFSKILFRPRILIDVSKIDITTTFLGFNISMPIMIAPTAMQKMAHPEGEYATARAASAADTIMTLSSWATSSVEEVASTGPGIRFFQLYVLKDRNVVAQLVRRAERAGFKAIALTVDTPRLGRREADIKNRCIATITSYYSHTPKYYHL